MQENSDEDESNESDDLLQENNMQVAAQDLEDDINRGEDVQANSKYVESIDFQHGEFEDDEGKSDKCGTYNFWVQYVTGTENLKVGDIFESKVKLLQVITEWFIQRGVSFSPVKTNRACYTIICTSIIEGDNESRDVCLWRLHTSVLESSVGYFKISSYIWKHTYNQPSLRSNHRKVSLSFVCNVILS